MTNDGKEFPIITFDQIVDTEIGLIKLINDRYHNTDTFYWSLIEAPTKVILWLLYNRRRKNPLTVIAKERDNKELMDSYYDEFMEKEYVYILKNSIVTNLYDMTKVFVETKGVKPYIYCKNDMEANYLTKIDKDTFNKCELIVSKSYNDAITELNDTIYLKSFDEVLGIYEKAIGKHLYLSGYRYNYEDDEKTRLLQNYSTLCKSVMAIKIYEPYKETDMIKGV